MAANAQAVLLDGALASMLELALAASNQSKSRSSNSLRGDPGGNRLQGVENKLAMSRNPSLYFLHRILEERRIEILMRSFLPEVLPLFVAINRRPALLEEEDDDGDDNDMREDEHYEQDEEQGEERDGYHKVERDEDEEEDEEGAITFKPGFFTHGSVPAHSKGENEEKEEEDKRIEASRLESFCSNEIDGRRLRLEYWRERLKLVKAAYAASENGEKAVDKIVYLSKRTELDMVFKRRVLSAKEIVRDNRNKSDATRQDLLHSTEAFVSTLQAPAPTPAPTRAEENKQLLEVERLLADLRRGGEAEITRRKAAMLVKIKKTVKEDRRCVLREAQEFIDQEMATDSDSKSELERIVEQSGRDNEREEARAAKLKDLASHVSHGLQEFHSGFVESLSRSARMAIEAIDRRFVLRDASAEVPALQHALFLRSELGAVEAAAHETSRVLCQSMLTDLDERLAKERQLILDNELARIAYLAGLSQSTEQKKKRAEFAMQMAQLVK
jgi:hypothetical protein